MVYKVNGTYELPSGREVLFSIRFLRTKHKNKGLVSRMFADDAVWCLSGGAALRSVMDISHRQHHRPRVKVGFH